MSLPIIIVSSKPIKWAIDNILKGIIAHAYFALNINGKTKELLEDIIEKRELCPIILIAFNKEILWKSVKGVIIWEITSLANLPRKVEEAKRGIEEISSWTGGYFNYLYEQLNYLHEH